MTSAPAASFHASAFGGVYRGPRDIDGFVYTTREGWAGANMDWGPDPAPTVADDGEGDPLQELVDSTLAALVAANASVAQDRETSR